MRKTTERGDTLMHTRENEKRIGKAAAAIAAVALAATLSSALAGCKNAIADEVATLQEEAVAPVLSVLASKASVEDGGSIALGTVSTTGYSDLGLTITNKGKKDLLIDVAGIAIAPDSSTAADVFALSAAPAAKVSGSGSTTLRIRFAPGTEGAKSATLTIPTNDSKTPLFKCALAGTGWAVVLSTNAVSGISQTSATCGVKIDDSGGMSLAEHGVCWGRSEYPTVADNKAGEASSALGTFSFLMTNLNPGDGYYVRAYVTNGSVTGYGQQISFATIPADPATPTGAAIGYAAGSGKLAVSWPAVNGSPVYYDVYYGATAERPGSPNGPTNLTSASCTLTGLTDYSGYYIWVVAKNATGSSSASPTMSSPAMPGVKVASISLSKSSATFLPGSSETIAATVFPASATNPNVSWSSNVTGVATVSGGTVTGGSSVGVATITAAPFDGQGGTPATFTATTKAFAANTAGPAGGILFYDSGSYGAKGWRYLEAASVNIGAGHTWRNANTGITIDIPGAQGTDFGTGKANTAAIIAAQGAGTYFANDCAAYSQNGFADWFMPSETEANYLLFVFTYVYYSPLVLFVSSSQYANGLGNGCYGFDCTSSTWKTMLTSYAGGSVVITRPIRQF